MNRFDRKADMSQKPDPNTGLTPEDKNLDRIARSDADALILQYGNAKEALKQLKNTPLADVPMVIVNHKVTHPSLFGGLAYTSAEVPEMRINGAEQLRVERIRRITMRMLQNG